MRFVPLEHRILVVNLANIPWTTYLALQAAKPAAPAPTASAYCTAAASSYVSLALPELREAVNCVCSQSCLLVNVLYDMYCWYACVCIFVFVFLCSCVYVWIYGFGFAFAKCAPFTVSWGAESSEK